MTQRGQLERLRDAVYTQGGKIKKEWGNADGSITVHIVPADGRGVMAYLIKPDGTATKSWSVSPREFDKLRRRNTGGSRRKSKKEFAKQGLFGPGTEPAPKQKRRLAQLRKIGVYTGLSRRQRTTKRWPPSRQNPSKAVTLRNMASVTIKRLPGGAVEVTGRHLKGGKR